ncbi:MAG: tryptophan-rich sensory protein [bacterium]|nr:tryptophan-rich sensory protein [bacterium]
MSNGRRWNAPFSLLVFVGLIVICFAASAIGAWATFEGLRDWYPELQKPSFNPPNWIFGPVWSTLYFMMAVSAWMVWLAAGFKGAKLAMTMFFVQLALNVAWSWIFFFAQQPGWAVVEIVLLWAAILATIVLFFPKSRIAAAMLCPYLAWVSFATVLNASIWWLNR